MKALIFDLDGTLIHSAPDIHAAAARMLEDLDRPSLSLETIVSFIGNGVPKLVERCVDATGGGNDALRAKALELFNDAYGAAPAVLTRPYPHVETMLQSLLDTDLRLGVCTNKPQAFTETVLEQLDLRRFFGSVVGGDRLAVRKPDPAPLRLCFEELGVSASGGAYVGDSETDEATAIAAGAPFLFFTGGYRKKSADEFQADFRFENFAALDEFVRTRRAG